MIHKTEEYVFFNEHAIFQEIYGHKPNVDQAKSHENTSFIPLEEFYQIATPFFMDSQLHKIFPDGEESKCIKIKCQDQSLSLVKTGNRKRRRKNVKSVFNDGPDARFVGHAFSQFSEWLKLDPQSSQNNTNMLFSNKLARSLVADSPVFQPCTGDLSTLQRVTLVGNCSFLPCLPYLYVNETPNLLRLKAVSIERGGNDRPHYYLIPKNSSFLGASINMLRHFINGGHKFDVVVADPPWPNKSIKRKKSYEILELHQLKKQLPINRLIHQHGLLCMWVSNSERIRHFVCDLIENQWSMTVVATWFWLKVCTNGTPVCAFDHPHKRPFERLIFACPKGMEAQFHLPPKYIIINVPNAFPSRKPPITMLLARLGHIPANLRTLELFARYLLPNTTSVGYEPLKFQEEFFFSSSHSHATSTLKN